MKKVLIALDYDPTAQKVAETGYALAKSMNAQIILLHVITDPVYYSSLEYSPVMGYAGISTADMMQVVNVDALKKAAQDFLDKSSEHLGSGDIQTRVAEGDCSDSILETAKDLEADIIVMGTHSRRWLDKILMGSVAEQVLNRSGIPMLVVPTNEAKK